MPLNLPPNLPAIELLKRERIFVMDSLRATKQDIRPLRVIVLNLMPLKITTETDLVRLLSNSPLQIIAESFGSTQIIEQDIEVNLRFPGQYFDAEMI